MHPRKRYQRPKHNPPHLPCPVEGCLRLFRSYSGRTKHVRCLHQQPAAKPPPASVRQSPTTPPLNNVDTDGGPALNMDVDDLFHVPEDEDPQWRFSPLHALQGEDPPRSPGPLSNNGSPPTADKTPPISWHHHPFLDGKFHPPDCI